MCKTTVINELLIFGIWSFDYTWQFNSVFFFSLQGKDKTEKANFGGGNTAWEERKLGSWANRYV